MGAEVFYSQAKGKTAKEAFANAQEQAWYDYGHAGYTGTIAEKDSFKMISLPEGISPGDYADIMIQSGKVDGKWGPAWCIDLGNGEFYFFGWASC